MLRMKESSIMAKSRAMPTEPRVFKPRVVNVSCWDWQTRMSISNPAKKASQKNLRSLNCKVRLKLVKMTKSRCARLVIIRRKHCACGLPWNPVAISAIHHNSPKRKRLQICSAYVTPGFSYIHRFLGKKRKKISPYLFANNTLPSSPYRSSRLRCRYQKWKSGYAVASMKATTAAAALIPLKTPWDVQLRMAVNCSPQASMRERYWQNTIELKMKQGLRTKVMRMCRQKMLSFQLREISHRSRPYLRRRLNTMATTPRMRKAMAMLQILRKKPTSVQYCSQYDGVLQYSSQGRPCYQEVGFTAIFCPCVYLNPTKAYLRALGVASAATKICNHIFCRLCMKWVQPVWHPKKKAANPTQMTDLDTTSKKMRMPLMLFALGAGVYLTRGVQLALLSTILRVEQEVSSWSSLAVKKGCQLILFCVSVLTNSGYLQMTVRLALSASEGKACSMQVTELFHETEQGILLPLISSQKIYLNKVSLLLTYARLNCTWTLRALSQLQSTLYWKGQNRQSSHPTAFSWKSATPNLLTVPRADTTSKETESELLESQIWMAQKEMRSVCDELKQMLLPNSEYCLERTSRSLRQSCIRSLDSHLSILIRQNCTIFLQCT